MEKQGKSEKLSLGFLKIFDEIDQLKIKEQVDEIGINKFINKCSRRAAYTGALSGLAGVLALVIGVPADLINNTIQQFRVTLAVIYHKTGRYKISFEEFMKIVAVSVGVEASVTGIKFLAIKVAEKIILKQASRIPGKLIPGIGAFIGGGASFLFIKSLGKSLMKLNIEKYMDKNQLN